MAHSFLVEIGTEELPPTSLKELRDAFCEGIEKGLRNLKIDFDNSQRFATPRRLAVIINGLQSHTPVEENQIWGPPAKIAFDAEGKPTKAAEAFAKKNNIPLDALATASDGKQDKLVCASKSGGEASKDLLGNIVRDALAALPIKKRMRWGASRNEFVRPLQWVAMLLDNDVLPEEVLGIKADRHTRGHRFHANTLFDITDISRYSELLLEQGHIIADFDARQAAIKEQVEKAAQDINGKAVIDSDLLDEVTALVEYPVALAGRFEESFLAVPAQALISSMKEHQKYFHVVDDNDQLMPYFITVSNIKSKDPAQVIDGNERVIRPRLADAAFFFETDKKTTLESRREKLKSVMFQAKLGSVYDKTERISRLAAHISEQLKSGHTPQTVRAAELCKSDLVSAMVYEFPEMQGIAGASYALNDGEPAEVAQAITEQYMPKFAGDDVPASDIGAFIALADRIDTVTGIFGIGLKPTGSKDPFALRRASVGLLRILVEKSYALDLRELITFAAKGFEGLSNENVIDDVLSYCLERFKAWYEEENITPEIFQSVHAKKLSTPFDINRRVHAVAAFTKLPEAQSLAAANKRVSNILNKHEGVIPEAINAELFSEAAESALHQALEQSYSVAKPMLQDSQYTEALSALAELKEPVDTFFDDVMVMTDDSAVRDNRLALLSQLRAIFLEVADISYLVVKA